MNQEDVYTYNLFFLCIYIYIHGCFLKWWYPQNTQKWPFLVGKPMVVGETHHFRKPPHIYYIYIYTPPTYNMLLAPFSAWRFYESPEKQTQKRYEGQVQVQRLAFLVNPSLSTVLVWTHMIGNFQAENLGPNGPETLRKIVFKLAAWKPPK